MTSKKLRLALAAPLFLAFTMGADRCGGVEPPGPKEDQPPIITFQHFVTGASVVPDIVSSTEPVDSVEVQVSDWKACVPHLALWTYADNPGGVKSLSVVVTREGLEAPLYQVAFEAFPDENGNVPSQLWIPGHDGMGGVGPQAIDLFFEGEIEPCHLNPHFTVTAEASNFNGDVATFREDIAGLYQTCCP